MTKDEALKLALEALKQIDEAMPFPVAKLAQKVIKEALAEPEQEPVAWNVIDPTGKIVATEMNSVRGWARIEGYKPTVEGLLGFHEQGWRVVPTTPPQRTWVGLTDEEIEYAFKTNSVMVDNGNAYMVAGLRAVNIARAIEAALKAKNT
jgi:hypothetical protein